MKSRRDFLKSTVAYSLGFTGLASAIRCNANTTPGPHQIVEGFGPLQPDPAGILDLPKGFSCRVISQVGETMSDGLFVPGAPDGMAAFSGPENKTLLIRNHELDMDHDLRGAFGEGSKLFKDFAVEHCYDSGFGVRPGQGGTTTMLYNPATGVVESQWLSLAGTLRNCAGGPTPWGSWVTCEETTKLKGIDAEQDHGYNFEVPATHTPALAAPVPLIEMGRFRHEAIAVDPASGVVYETEDVSDGCIYRYLPNEPGQLAKGGKLQALRVIDKPTLDTRNWETQRVQVGEQLAVDWIDVENVRSPDDDLREQGADKGAAVFARGEGMWAGNGAIYFACTNGGKAQVGQIWKYTPSAHEGQTTERNAPGTLELFIEPNDRGLIDKADNITVTPWGDLIVCEDGSDDQFLVGVTQNGEIYKFARNAKDESEFAGATFSPDGSTLFVNMQSTGITLAIAGPWREVHLRG
jgi:hypothetical protein